MTTIDPADLSVGSISHGTLRHEDLIPAFTTLLEGIDRERARELKETYGDVYAALDGEGKSLEEVGEGSDWLLSDLDDAINAKLPEGFYFGAIEGDGSDFGIWQAEQGDDTDE